MATTLQNILSTIRNAGILFPSQINFGFVDELIPPYANVMDFTSEQTYDTSGATIKDSKFKVLITGKTFEEAETYGDRVNTLLDTSTTVTPLTMRCLQDSYAIGQVDEKLYQFVGMFSYTLQEDLRKA